MESKLYKHINGNKEWRNSLGQLHRENGPARIRADGTQEWWINGKRHRRNGPAIEWNDGEKEWYLNGELHREDGPAIIYPDGSKLWYLNGINVSPYRVLHPIINKININSKDIYQNTIKELFIQH